MESERKVHVLQKGTESLVQEACVDECLPPDKKSGERRQPGPLGHTQGGNWETGTGTPRAGGSGKKVVSAVEHARVVVPSDGTAGVFNVRGLRRREQPGDPIWCERDVTVNDGDPFCWGVKNTGVHGVSESLVAAQCEDPGAEVYCKLRALVSGGVIDDQHLAGWHSLTQRRTHGFPQQTRSIEIRYDDDDWRGHTRPKQASGMVSRSFGRGQSSERAAMMGL
ncbi:MAG: hypothetical protein ABSC08_04755 [Bryobacteraceae bacterium]